MTCLMKRCNRMIRQIWLECSLKTSIFFQHELDRYDRKTDFLMSVIRCEFLGFIGGVAFVSFLLGCEAVSLASLFPKLQHHKLASLSRVEILIYGSLTLPHALGLVPR